MTEPPRRVTVQAEVDEETAAILERAIASGDFADAGEVLEAELAEWEYARWERDDPEGWAEHVAEMHRRLDALDADPSRAIPLEESAARLAARFAVRPEAAE